LKGKLPIWFRVFLTIFFNCDFTRKGLGYWFKGVIALEIGPFGFAFFLHLFVYEVKRYIMHIDEIDVVSHIKTNGRAFR